MKYTIFLAALLCTCCSYNSFSQSFAINTDGSIANASALLDVKSTAKGVLVPRMTKTEKEAIVSPATGLLVFQNSPDSIGFHFYNGSNWIWFGDAANTDSASWKTTGNNNIKSTNFIGTLNDTALRFRIRNISSGILDSASQNTSLGYKTLYANSTGYGNTALGFRSLASNSTGSENVAIGDSALNTNPTGVGLVAIGFKALTKNKSGSLNTAVGYQALANDTTGFANTAIGAYTLYLNSRGFANTAVGSSALSSVTTGQFNTAVGQAALYQHNKFGGNTAVGSNALQNDTTGFNNTAIGLSSMLSNTNVNYNPALGTECFKNHNNNDRNTALGSLALFSDISGIENTVVGYDALRANTTGFYNTAIGANTNVTANNLTNATAIGYRAMVGQSNTLILGSIAGINAATADTKVGIGTTTPAQKLSVNGTIESMSGGYKFPDATIQTTAATAIPAGTMLMYAGTVVPAGYLACDGSAINRATYANLFTALGVAWGSGDGSTTFNLPDLRGRFPRGVSHVSGNDPDAALRTASNPGGNTGNAIGSLQSDTLKSHSHEIGALTGPGGTHIALYTVGTNATQSGLRTEVEGGNENRPKNVYVYYIIKF